MNCFHRDPPGFVHLYIGAETVVVGICAHLIDQDSIRAEYSLETMFDNVYAPKIAEGIKVGT
jgi:TPP-dependent pyruvate/acetoin dehydrogenase alpha subunit